MKTANRNLLLLGIPALLVLVLGFLWGGGGNQMLHTAHDMVEEASHHGGSDMEGYGALARMAGAGMGGALGFAAWLVGGLAMMYAGAILVLSVAARLIYGKTPGRILAYRIVMCLAFVVLLMPYPSILRTFVLALAGGSFLPLWFGYLVVTLILAVVGCRNTYSRKVYY
ncbi:hypothetical protein H6B15_03505 [Gemmiger formicilis]|uniref:hypothetical protein n=1 Tax=Gemmiger formicilis TaxID=745368 RepID=UPI001959D314|nr:hypothetical protein [Gemmiger formicilis]MBM6715726.1 hypothetical protein [Gemmiger formicilis]